MSKVTYIEKNREKTVFSSEFYDSMATKKEKQEFLENFIEIWRKEKSLWDVNSPLYKDKNAKSLSYGIFKERLYMEGLLFFWLLTKAGCCFIKDA